MKKNHKCPICKICVTLISEFRFKKPGCNDEYLTNDYYRCNNCNEKMVEFDGNDRLEIIWL